MDATTFSLDDTYDDQDDYTIVDLDQMPKSSAPQAHPSAFEEFDLDDDEAIDLDFKPPEEKEMFDDDMLEKDDIDYDDIVESYEEIENQQLSDSEEDEELNHKQKFFIPKRTNTRKAASKLNEDLRNVLSHALILKADQKYEDAIKICQGIIKEAPMADEVYFLLASLYELTGKVKEAEEFKELATIMAPSSREVVEKDLKKALAAENYRPASYLYGKLTRMDANNLQLHQQYIKTLEMIGAEDRLLMAKAWMIRAMRDPSMAEEAKELAVKTAFQLMAKNSPSKAKVCLENFVNFHHSHVDVEIVNLLTEVYIKLDDYEGILLCLTAKAGVKAYDSEGVELFSIEDFVKLANCVVPDDLPTELKSKLCIALVGLGFPILAQPLEEILLVSREHYADEIVEIACTHKKKGNFERAELMLMEITSLPDHDTAQNWVLLAECLEGSGSLEKASAAFRAAVERDLENMDIRCQYGMLLEKMGNIREAIHVMTQDPSFEKIDTDAQYKLCLLCKRNMKLSAIEGEREYVDDFFKAVLTLFGRHCIHIKSRTEFEAFFSLNLRTKHFGSRSLTDLHQEAQGRNYTKPKHSPVDEFSLFEETFDILLSQKLYPQLERLVFQALMSTVLNRGETWRKKMWAKAFIAAYLNRDSIPLLARSRALLENGKSNKAWNFFNMACNRMTNLRYSRTVLRYSDRNPECLPARIMTANSALAAGSYKYALNEYTNAMTANPSDPMVLLCLGCVYIHLACQKASDKKSSLIAQGIAFFQAYKEVRGEGQETYYNLGRAYHQVGLLHQALHNYRLALEQKPWLPAHDLTREIAVNIVVLYKMTGARDLALFYLKKYLTG